MLLKSRVSGDTPAPAVAPGLAVVSRHPRRTTEPCLVKEVGLRPGREQWSGWLKQWMATPGRRVVLLRAGWLGDSCPYKVVSCSCLIFFLTEI